MKKEKGRIIYTLIAAMIIVYSSSYIVLMTLERTDYKNYLQSQYSKNLYNLSSNVENIRSNLSKVPIIGSKEQGIVIFDEIFRYSSMAEENLHSLPISQRTISHTSKFLNQVGDFCYTLSKRETKKEPLTDKEISTIDDLEMQAYSLETELNNVLNDTTKGKVKWADIRKKTSEMLASNEVKDKSVENRFDVIQKQVNEYPVLIYDGPFSDNTLAIKPRILSQKIVSSEQGKEAIIKLYGKENIKKIEQVNEAKDKKVPSKIPSYKYNVELKNEKQGESIVAEVSKNGGHLVYLLYNKKPDKKQISAEKANEIGIKKLQNMGYSNMKSTYTLTYDKEILISYVAKKDNIIMYPDQIKLKISLVDGQITGVEADKYLIAHVNERNIPTVKITSEEGKHKVSKRIDLKRVSLAVIPTENNKEVLCYEYIGEYKGRQFIIYINAKTGYEERIVEIINTPNGKLTI
ncbi:germination protein YpeB [Hathewaya limosa]|uniref:Germination protein YpeB n=1 Tax=Hathewaya limosa TaxID=1536 RepID=A0ABU0JR47_HATLI|nr:germination protein YpeB [Hathewaya limosa]AWZ49327.1 germination protein YpeB [Clostridiaceae bacterium 14S0207]MDQ0478377.1 germination protein YpeB [Hathewaya limosa]